MLDEFIAYLCVVFTKSIVFTESIVFLIPAFDSFISDDLLRFFKRLCGFFGIRFYGI